MADEVKGGIILNSEPTDAPAKIDPEVIVDGLKSGWRSSEFWATIGVLVLAALTSLGILTNAQASSIERIIGSIIALVSGSATVGVYAWLRTSLKKDQ